MPLSLFDVAGFFISSLARLRGHAGRGRRIARIPRGTADGQGRGGHNYVTATHLAVTLGTTAAKPAALAVATAAYPVSPNRWARGGGDVGVAGAIRGCGRVVDPEVGAGGMQRRGEGASGDGGWA